MPTLNFINPAATQRLLTRAEGALAVSLQRLSSGLRINSAADDAAGLSISQRLTAQVRGLNQGVRNANDAISVTQTADASLASMTSLLQRVRELAVQAANASNSTADRAALDGESSQLLLEIQRIASQTQLNGLNLLDGTFTSQLLQVGANNGDTITVGIADARLGSASSYAYASAGDVDSRTIGAGDLTINIGGGPVTIGASANASAAAKAAAINAAGIPGLTATATNVQVFSPLSGAGIVAGYNDGFAGYAFRPGDYATHDFSINGTLIYTGFDVAVSVAGVAGLVNSQSATTGVSATVNGSGQLQLTSATGAAFTVLNSFSFLDAADGVGSSWGTGSIFSPQPPTLYPDHSAVFGGTSTAYLGQLSIASAQPLTLGGAAVNPAQLIGISPIGTPVVGMANFSLATRASALTTITSVDQVLDRLNAGRAYLGAMQNRLMAAAANASASSQAAAATRSSITDADFATETAELSRAMILRQSGVALTAQANSAPQLVLSLLKSVQ